MLITWDTAKEAANRQKHGISFEEARTVFQDLDAIYIRDTDSADEERWVVIGYSDQIRLLLVIHTESDDSEIIRIISARRPTRTERKAYEERN